MIPEKMSCIESKGPGPADTLVIGSRACPHPDANSVLIEVFAAGLNRPDIAQRLGNYPPPSGASDILGLEIAGIIVALGENARTLNPELNIGMAVCALVSGGGYAEYCVAPAGSCLPIPDGWSMVEAASLPETYCTVWHNVFQRGALVEGESFLVHGGTSGIGITAIQLARLFGATVFATARGAEKCSACETLGAHHAIDYASEDFVAVIREVTQKRGVDVILDMVGGAYVNRNIKSLAVEGRLVNIAYLNGANAEIDMMPILLKRLVLTGSTLRQRPDPFKAALMHELFTHVWPHLSKRSLRPVIHEVFPFVHASRAHAMMETSRHIGKIILEVKK